ncbi:DUF2968 domain-containing protein [Trinickia sp.]|uniref:DUF2968 domain-containing protein n=1 Tax=Trinickia sp. TaxID=2571163 RepID=UPI003F7FAA27
MKLYLNKSAAETVKDTLVDDVPAAVEPTNVPHDEAGLLNTPTLSPLRPMNAVMPHGSARAAQPAEIAAVEALSASHALTLLRTLNTFSYSVDLLFHSAELSYYVTLSQDGNLWRALHAAELDTAEAAFRHFEDLATRLADVELKHIQLQAQNEHIEAMAAASEAQAQQLRDDLERHAEQTQFVNNQQQQARKEVAQLEAQRIAAQARLNKALRQMHQLRVTSNERLPHPHCRRTDS